MPGPQEVVRTAEKLRIKAELHEGIGAASTAAEAARALGVEAGHVGKSILLVVRESEPVLVIVAGPDKVDFEKVAAHVSADAGDVRLAEPDEVEEHTGFPVGAVPPLALKRPIRTLLDRRLTDADRIFVGAGSDEAMLEIEAKGLRQLPDLTLGDFSKSGPA